MRKKEIETDYGYNEELGCDVWINCTDKKLGTKVMSNGKVLNDIWWQAKIHYGKHIKKKKIIIY